MTNVIHKSFETLLKNNYNNQNDAISFEINKVLYEILELQPIDNFALLPSIIYNACKM